MPTDKPQEATQHATLPSTEGDTSAAGSTGVSIPRSSAEGAALVDGREAVPPQESASGEVETTQDTASGKESQVMGVTEPTMVPTGLDENVQGDSSPQAQALQSEESKPVQTAGHGALQHEPPSAGALTEGHRQPDVPVVPLESTAASVGPQVPSQPLAVGAEDHGQVGEALHPAVVPVIPISATQISVAGGPLEALSSAGSTEPTAGPFGPPKGSASVDVFSPGPEGPVIKPNPMQPTTQEPVEANADAGAVVQHAMGIPSHSLLDTSADTQPVGTSHDAEQVDALPSTGPGVCFELADTGLGAAHETNPGAHEHSKTMDSKASQPHGHVNDTLAPLLADQPAEVIYDAQTTAAEAAPTDALVSASTDVNKPAVHTEAAGQLPDSGMTVDATLHEAERPCDQEVAVQAATGDTGEGHNTSALQRDEPLAEGGEGASPEVDGQRTDASAEGGQAHVEGKSTSVPSPVVGIEHDSAVPAAHQPMEEEAVPGPSPAAASEAHQPDAAGSHTEEESVFRAGENGRQSLVSTIVEPLQALLGSSPAGATEADEPDATGLQNEATEFRSGEAGQQSLVTTIAQPVQGLAHSLVPSLVPAPTNAAATSGEAGTDEVSQLADDYSSLKAQADDAATSVTETPDKDVPVPQSTSAIPDASGHPASMPVAGAADPAASPDHAADLQPEQAAVPCSHDEPSLAAGTAKAEERTAGEEQIPHSSGVPQGGDTPIQGLDAAVKNGSSSKEGQEEALSVPEGELKNKRTLVGSLVSSIFGRINNSTGTDKG